MQVEKLSGNPKPLDILAKINQIIDNMVVSVNGSGADGNGNIDVAIIPVGTIYVQFAGQTDPTTLFGGTWENVSSIYAGLFFRAEGGAAAAFGSSQDGGAPNITGSFGNLISVPNAASANGAFACAETAYSYRDGSGVTFHHSYFDFYASRSHSGYQLGEFRPINRTIRIWKRTV